MSRYRVNQHLIVPKLVSISINKFLVTERDVKYVSTVKSTTYYERVFKTNGILGKKHSKKENRLQDHRVQNK